MNRAELIEKAARELHDYLKPDTPQDNERGLRLVSNLREALALPQPKPAAVIQLGGQPFGHSTLDPEKVLVNAMDRTLKEVVVLGFDKDGDLYMASSHPLPDMMFLLKVVDANLSHALFDATSYHNNLIPIS